MELPAQGHGNEEKNGKDAFGFRVLGLTPALSFAPVALSSGTVTSGTVTSGTVTSGPGSSGPGQ